MFSPANKLTLAVVLTLALSSLAALSVAAKSAAKSTAKSVPNNVCSFTSSSKGPKSAAFTAQPENVKTMIHDVASLDCSNEVKRKISTSPVFYLSEDVSACGGSYKNSDAGICVSEKWTDKVCNGWVDVSLPSLGTTVTARVLDFCSSTKCNDVYLTLSAFSALAKGNKTILEKGRLPGPVVWKPRSEPCWACYAGLPGKSFITGKADTCVGDDGDGFNRKGRKRGSHIVKGEKAGKLCAGSPAKTEGVSGSDSDNKASSADIDGEAAMKAYLHALGS